MYFTPYHRFLLCKSRFPGEWRTEFFFTRPMRESWNCLTKWSETYCRPSSKASSSMTKSAVNLGITKHQFEYTKLLQKEILVHGGIEPGIPPLEVTFRSLMNKIKSPVRATKKKQKRLSSMSETDVSIPEDLQHYSEDSIPVMELYHKKKGDESANSLATVADVPAQPRTLPSPMLTMSEMLEMMNVHYQKFEMEMQELTSELKCTKSRVQELEQELKISESKRVDAEKRTFSARKSVNHLEETLEKLKLDMDLNRDKIGKDAIDAFKSSQEFLDSCEKNKNTIDSFKSSQEFLGSLDQIRRDAIKKYKLSDEFLDWNDKIRRHAIKTFKDSDEFLERHERTKKDVIKEFKCSEEYLNSLARAEKFAVESFKSSSEFFDFRDDTRKEAIEVFRSSAEFHMEVQKEAVKQYASGFEACMLQFLNSGKLPKGFNFDFLNVGAGMFGRSPGQVHDGTKSVVNLKFIKPER